MFFSFLVLIAFVCGSKYNITYARTMAFIVISLSQMFHAFNARSNKSLFKIGVFSNKYLVYATGITLLFMGMVCFIPVLVDIFGLCILNLSDYLLCIGLSLLPIFVMEIKKS